MTLCEQQCVQLLDEQDRLLGYVEIGETRNQLVFGRFREGPHYATVAQVFAEQREAANLQLFSRVDELDGAIAALRLRLGTADNTPLPAIEDVQIGEGRITFRVSLPTFTEQGRNGALQIPVEPPRPGERVA